MSASSGRWIPLSPGRKIIDDMMHASSKVPRATMHRRFHLADVVAARAACAPRPSWVALFLKAFAIVAQSRPELRRAYMPLPWPHLYEHPHSVAMFSVERLVGDEEVVAVAQQAHIDTISLAEMDAFVRLSQTRPLEEFPTWRRARRMTWLPRFLRRLIWSYGLNTSGAQRARLFGTFGLSSAAAAGGGLHHVLAPITSTIHYGMLEADHSLDVRLSFDHRVYDGAVGCRALVDMENVMCGQLVQEMRGRQAA